MEDDRDRMNIVNFSDYVLLEVLKYLNATDLWQLSRTCERFRYLVGTKKLWRKIDLRDRPIVAEKVTFALKRASELTEDIRLCAAGRHLPIIPDDFLTCLSSTNLTVLALENQYIAGDSVNLKDFPGSLLELSLRKTYVTCGRSFLNQSNERMKNLKVLILDQCFWVEANMLVQLSKYQSLEILSLYNCRRVSDRDIAYISLAGRWGFKNLRVLDCRFSGLGDQLLRTLYHKRGLREIYFQSYPTTYFFERGLRRLDVQRGSPVRDYSYVTELDDLPMFDRETVELYFGDVESRKTSDLDTVSDEGTLIYRFTESSNETSDANGPESVLYERPYPECTCSKNGANAFLRNKGPSHKMKSLKRRSIVKMEETIANELRYATDGTKVRSLHLIVPVDRNCPNFDPNVEATMENHYTDWINRRLPRNDYEMTMLEHSDLNRCITECNVTVLVLGTSQYYSLVSSPPEAALGSDQDRPPSPENQPRRPNDESARRTEGTSSADSDDRPTRRVCRKRKRTEDGCRLLRRVAREGGVAHPVQFQYRLFDEHEPLKYRVGLRNVSLRGFKRVTDRTLEWLAHLNLSLLDVTFTGVTEDGVAEFAAANPDCRIVHESLCRCGPRMHF